MWRGVAAAAALLGLAAASDARAADITTQTYPSYVQPVVAIDPANRWEARFGVFYHGMGTPEQDTVDLNGEVVSPRLWDGSALGFWSWTVPRLAFGGSVNLHSRTNFAYLSLLWTLNWTERVFTEIYVGPSIHDGSLLGTPTMAGLGCRALIHAGVSIGYRFTERVSGMFTYQHLSNASDISGCPRNQALDNVGLRLSYGF